MYWPALAPLFESGEAAVLELEPQTLWKKASNSHGFAYQLNEELFESVASLPQPKLMHGVGQPVAGTVDDPTEYVPLLRHMARHLQPAWISEHLSFNRVRQGRGPRVRVSAAAGADARYRSSGRAKHSSIRD